MIKHHSAFKNIGIFIVKSKLTQKYMLMGKALIHRKKLENKIKYWVIKMVYMQLAYTATHPWQVTQNNSPKYIIKS